MCIVNIKFYVTLFLINFKINSRFDCNLKFSYFRYFMGTTEKVIFRPDGRNSTKVEKSIWIESDVFGFQSAIRKFGVDRFKRNCLMATSGFDFVLQRIYNKTNQSKSVSQSSSNKKTFADNIGHNNKLSTWFFTMLSYWLWFLFPFISNCFFKDFFQKLYDKIENVGLKTHKLLKWFCVLKVH